MYRVPDIIIEASRDLRKNMTSSEKEIWKYLRGTQLGTKVLQQKPIYVCTENSGQNRFVIADFYIPEHRIVVEIDGGIHNLDEVLELDREKEKLLNNLGIDVIRIQNEQVFDDIDKVLLIIKSNL